MSEQDKHPKAWAADEYMQRRVDQLSKDRDEAVGLLKDITNHARVNPIAVMLGNASSVSIPIASTDAARAFLTRIDKQGDSHE
jgi:hypothetical protein